MKNLTPPPLMWDTVGAGWDQGVWSSDEMDADIQKILNIIGNAKRNLKDAATMETALRSGCKYFITNDKADFIRHRASLARVFPDLRVMTVEELKAEIEAHQVASE
jgi:predicted nucleic acid-binding protein